MSKSSWHTLKPHQVVQALKTDSVTGLSADEASRRLASHGYNAFERERAETFFDRLVRQFKSPLVLILLFAGVATLALGHHIDTTVIFVALAVNIGIGLFQEARASRAFEKLSASQERSAIAVRDGAKRIVDATKLVPGDLVVITAGSVVPADVYLLEARELETNEAPLTGESASVAKDIEVSAEGAPVTDQKNMAWMGTLVSSGDGRGLVVATGDDTQMGRIAEGLADTEEVATPVQKSIKRLAHFLSALIGAIVLVIFVLGLVRGESFDTMILLAIAVAVSVIPEGLPAAVTAILAIGMEKILSRGGLVRNLLAAETLGSTTVILTDKTGTLTKAQMRLFLTLTASGASEHELSDDARRAIGAALQASDAFVERDGAGDMIVRGRPIEKAIVEGAAEIGLEQAQLQDEEPKRDFLPFSSVNRFAAALRRCGDVQVLYVSGAPSTILEHANLMLHNGQEVPLNDKARSFFRIMQEKHAEDGVRFIAVGYKKTFIRHIPKIGGEDDRKELLKGLVFAGLLGFEDPIREDVPGAIATARAAGARVIMLTGDNPDTAKSIALQAGIIEKGAKAMRGTDLSSMTDGELLSELKRTSVFARMLPEEKLRIVKLLQKEGEIVAMTGDGINDAPALKRADIGVAVGSGTEVAKEASDLVLINNSFAIIVSAIEEGRRIIDNLKKAIAHLLSTSFGVVFVISGAIVFGFPLPILPVQILWLNIIEEGLLTFGFAFEPAEDGVMKRDPRASRVREIITKKMRGLIISAGVATGVLVFVLYFVLVKMSFSIELIRTVVFTALSFAAIFFAVSLKNFYQPVWRVKFFSNTYLVVAVGINAVLLLATLTFAPLREFLGLASLSGIAVVIVAVVAVLDVLIIETAKYILFERKDS